MIAHVIQCQIGRSASEDLSLEQKEFYTWLGNFFFDNSVPIVHFSRTIPISNYVIQNAQGTAYDLVSSCLKQASDDIPHGENLSLLIFDIDIRTFGQLRAKPYLMILRAICDWLREYQPPEKIILLVDSLPPQADFVWKQLNEIPSGTQLIIFDENGHSNPRLEISTTEFCKKLIVAKCNPRIAMNKKMVRHLGHFQKDKGGAKMCVRHFYDGQYCVSDIANLLLIELVDEINDGDTICYHAKRSPWVHKSIIDLQNRLTCKIQDITGPENDTILNDYYLILDFIDTGSTVLEAVKRIGRDPKRIISILAKPSENDKGKLKELKRKAAPSLSVEYLLEAEYSQLGLEGYCPLCLIDMPVDTLDELSASGTLRSLDFWEMVLSDCSDKEKNPPAHRTPETVIVNLSMALSQHGAFIASRVRQLIENMNFSPDSVLIFPKDEHVSGEFALHLFHLSSENHIAIPREAINAAAAGIEIDHAKHSLEDWYIELQSNSVKHCIIMDDILVTGSSMLGMSNIVKEFGKKVLAYIPITQYRGSNTKLPENNIYPLYSIDNTQQPR